MGTFTVALIQAARHGPDQRANLETGEALCRRAAEMGADMALFPEMWNIAYTEYPGTPGDYHYIGIETPDQLEARRRWQAQAVERDGPFVRRFAALARELRTAIAITYLECWPEAPRNTVTVFDRHGVEALTYAKVHTCDFDLEGALTPGTEFPVADLDTAGGRMRVGAMICYDREFPESARILMLGGAEVILVPNACTIERYRLHQLEARAFENMAGVAMANYPARPGREDNGHSTAYDGIAYGPNGWRDMTLVEAGEDEGIYLARFDLDALRAYRQRETWGNAFRRPHRYGALVATEIAPPFVRHDGRGVAYTATKR